MGIIDITSNSAQCCTHVAMPPFFHKAKETTIIPKDALQDQHKTDKTSASPEMHLPHNQKNDKPSAPHVSVGTGQCCPRYTPMPE